MPVLPLSEDPHGDYLAPRDTGDYPAHVECDAPGCIEDADCDCALCVEVGNEHYCEACCTKAAAA